MPSGKEYLVQTLPLLTTLTVERYLRGRGVIAGPATRIVELGGGVSNVVLSVATDTETLIVKQSLPRLRVDEEWLAPVGRIVTEARGLETCCRVVPHSAPPVRDSDDERFVLTMLHAPDGWTDWKSLLMAGTIDSAVASTVGRMLGQLHSRTTDVIQLDTAFLATDPFEQLRLNPYYRFNATKVPEFADELVSLADALPTRRLCLVHGDFSPKNILVGPPGEPGRAAPVWFIDFEVAHVGDPSFDAAFLLTHLTLKSLYNPSAAVRFDLAADAFVAEYGAAMSGVLEPDWNSVARHVGALLLARVHGKSPAEYLDRQMRAQAHSLAGLILASPHDLDPDALHHLRDTVLA